MKIIAAEHRGFCYGVKRAVAMAEDCIGMKGDIYTLGPIIHNPQVVKRFSDEGIRVVNDLSPVNGQSTVIIRSHGVGPDVYKEAESRKIKVVDATCPHVKKAQQAAYELLQSGFTVVIIGERHHPEVKSIIEWSNNQGIVVESAAEAADLPFITKMGVVVQTTFSKEDFQNIIDILQTKCTESKIFRTICAATDLRQQSALDIAAKVDVMVVVGGKNSANTSRLAQLCHEAGSRVYHVETAEELIIENFSGVETVGVTAGASTPDWLIEEVHKKMQEFSQMLNNEVNKLEQGSIVKGKIVGIRKDEVFVDIGYKGEGSISLAELAYPVPESAADVVSDGQIIDVFILDLESNDGVIKLSKVKADAIVAWDALEDALHAKTEVEAKVLDVVNGGLKVSVLGVNGFIPASQVELRFVEDLSSFKGQMLTVLPIEIDRAKKRVVLSRKIILEEQRRLLEEKAFAKLAVGQIVPGIVRRIVDFGVFVDIGGIDGLVHISDLAWHRVKNPKEIVALGDEVKVLILKIDPAAKRISLSLKEVGRDPWLDLIEQFTVGTIVTGKVNKLSKFGAFVELVPGIEGLVHMSELSDERVNKIEDVITIGQQAAVKILEINKENKRISLSISKARQDAERVEYQAYLDKQEGLGSTIGDKLGHLFKKSE